MKRKMLFWAMVCGIIVTLLIVENPLQMFFNFVIAGIVPGLNISLGFMPSIGVILALLWLMKRWIRDIRYQMIRRTALEMNAERVKNELQNAQQKESKERRQSVIAARTLKHANNL